MLASASFLAGLFAGSRFGDEVEDECENYKEDNEQEPDGTNDNGFFYDRFFAEDFDGLLGAEDA